jgi:hypothetical protein
MKDMIEEIEAEIARRENEMIEARKAEYGSKFNAAQRAAIQASYYQQRKGAKTALAIVEGRLPKWQPIEEGWNGPAYEHGVTWGDTAPRDGTDVLLFVRSTGEQFVGYWDAGDWIYALCRGTKVVCEPTHWMPLPQPPALTPTEEKQS